MADEIESEIREAFEAGNFQAAATRALEGYGPEILGFLVATHNDRQEASEVFSQVTEDLWRGIEGFRWRASFRTWLYTLTRHASIRYRRPAQRRAGMHCQISEAGELVDRIRTETFAYQKTEVKDRFRALREELSPEEQSLLILRVDRGLSWNEVAMIMGSEQPDRVMDDDAARRWVVALRKRFQALKLKLRRRAQAEGLIGDGAEEPAKM